MANPGKTSNKRSGTKTLKILLWCAGIAAATALAIAAFMAAAFMYYSNDLPRISRVKYFEEYKEFVPRVTSVYDRNGKVFTRFFEERRTPRPLKEIPEQMRKAVIAAEDSGFYRHKGIDLLHIFRAAVLNVVSGSFRLGASTITQQVVKTFLLTPEKSFRRKIKEIILARQLEQNLTKDEILVLYLNQIYMGHGNYGIAEAARFYFGKEPGSLALEECAMLAGIIQSPEKLSPYKHPERCKSRQGYVLSEMLSGKFITKAQYDQAVKAPLNIVFHKGEETTRDYYAEQIRQFLFEKFGREEVLRNGLRVDASVDGRMQDEAQRALLSGLREVDRRQGYRGPLGNLQRSAADALAKTVREKISTAAAFSKKRAQLLGCRDTLASGRMGFVLKEGAGLPADPVKLPDILEVVPIEPGTPVLGVVSRVGPKGIQVFTGSGDSFIPLASFGWARRYSPVKRTPPPGQPADIFNAGDVIQLMPVKSRVLVEAKKSPASPAVIQEFELDQEPLVQGALVALDTDSRDVLAMAGGSDFEKSPFNRAVQAHRQPGSAFKPIVYSLAIASKKYTPVTLVNDSPFIYYDAAGNEWRPENFESDESDGLMPLKEALAKSKNLVSARLVQDLGAEAVVEHAKNLGIQSQLPAYISISLGAGEVTPLELANAYATIAAGGVRASPVMVRSVKSSDGRVLWRHEPDRTLAIDPAVAFVTTDMMRGVIDHGTGVRAKSLGRPAAGKTGTTNESREAWFGGFIPHMLAMVYVGFDDHSPLGSREQGGRTAVPIWTDFMQAVTAGRPVESFPAPPGVVFAGIDGKTGLLAPPGAEGAVFQAFVSGTEPKPVEQKGSADFMRDDQDAPGSDKP